MPSIPKRNVRQPGVYAPNDPNSIVSDAGAEGKSAFPAALSSHRQQTLSIQQTEAQLNQQFRELSLQPHSQKQQQTARYSPQSSQYMNIVINISRYVR